MLRASNRIVEAEAALRAATRANPAFAEAWYNLADLLDDQGRSDAAVECLRKAIVGAPDYIDAMFKLALLLQRKSAYTAVKSKTATLKRRERKCQPLRFKLQSLTMQNGGLFSTSTQVIPN